MSKEAENKLIKSILDENVRFFCDQDNPLEVYVEYPEPDGSLATVPVMSQMFRAFLGYQSDSPSTRRMITITSRFPASRRISRPRVSAQQQSEEQG